MFSDGTDQILLFIFFVNMGLKEAIYNEKHNYILILMHDSR